MSRVMIAGSFDPITIGHEDLISRAVMLFDEVIVCVCENSSKKTMFTLDERIEFVRLAVSKYRGVRADICEGLVTDYAEANCCDAIVRGARTPSDYEYEQTLAAIYRELSPDIEMVILPAKTELAHISASMVRELIKYNKDFSPFVPKEIVGMI